VDANRFAAEQATIMALQFFDHHINGEPGAGKDD
jgi:hypothetical protein